MLGYGTVDHKVHWGWHLRAETVDLREAEEAPGPTMLSRQRVQAAKGIHTKNNLGQTMDRSASEEKFEVHAELLISGFLYGLVFRGIDC